jgi:hypothetical protein
VISSRDSFFSQYPSTFADKNINLRMTADETPKKHHRVKSSLDDFSLLTLDHAAGQKGEIQHSELHEIEISTEKPLPKSALIIVSETEQLEKNKDDDTATLIASLTDIDFSFSKLKVHSWDCTKQYSEFIKEGLEYKGVKIDDYENVVMLFESPSSSSDQSSFHNRGKFDNARIAKGQVIQYSHSISIFLAFPPFKIQRNSDSMTGRHQSPPAARVFWDHASTRS